MSNLVETYFSKHPYLPITPRLRHQLQAILDSSAPQETRRSAVEEAAYAYPTFTFNLLKLVNSEKFNLKTKIVVIKQASTIPTFELLADLLNQMPDYPADLESRFSLGKLEEHGRATALAVQLLATIGKRFSTQERERFFTAAILHDIGRCFLVMSDLNGYLKVVRDAEGDEESSVMIAEKTYFGTDHATLSAVALESIGITDTDMLTAVREHHGFPAGPTVLLAYADRFVKRFCIGPSDGVVMSVSMSNPDETRLKVALEEVLHMTIGDILMHVLSEIDTALTSGMVQFKYLAGGVK